MHPILAKKTWLLSYLALWALVGMMLAGLLRIPGALSWRDALIISIPLYLFYAFVCLTPWYMCRQLPLASTNPAKLALNHVGAAVLASVIWVERAADRQSTGRDGRSSSGDPAPGDPGIAAVSGLGGDALRAARGGAIARIGDSGARGRAARPKSADQSALFVQLS